MQTLVELVERLYDDLNLPQLIKEARKRQMPTPIVDGKYNKHVYGLFSSVPYEWLM